MNERPLRIEVFGYHTIGYRCLKELLDTLVQGEGEEVISGETWFHRAGVEAGMRLGEGGGEEE